MRLDDFCGMLESMPFPAAAEAASPDQQTLADVRAAVTRCVGDDAFLADCIALELRLIENMQRLRRGFVPFRTLPRTGIHLALGYWPPGSSVAPHEHTAWTVTSVCRNALQVLTFDRDESYRRKSLVLKNGFEAPAGKVGSIYGPCIHQPRNVSREWSWSLHVISPQDGKYPDGRPDLLPGMRDADGVPPHLVDDGSAYSSVMLARQRMAHVEQLSRTLAAMKVERASEVLGLCYELCSATTRTFIEQAAPHAVRDDARKQPFLLAKVHDDLTLSHRSDGKATSLMVETATGPQEALTVNAVAHEAIVYVSKHAPLDMREIPGRMNEEERLALAAALEQSGVFRRVAR